MDPSKAICEVASAVGLEEQICITGEPLMQERIPEFMHQGDLYCPCVWASDDDVDGLPQMLTEAMACGLPAVSTRRNSRSRRPRTDRLLTQPHDATELADCIQRLWDDPGLASRLALRGREHVLTDFDLATCLTLLTDYFESQLGAA